MDELPPTDRQTDLLCASPRLLGSSVLSASPATASKDPSPSQAGLATNLGNPEKGT